MHWIEVIALRSVDVDSEILLGKLQQLVGEVKKEDDAPAVKLFGRVMIDSDYCIHLCHDRKKIEPRGSRLGLCLASGLKEFGSVHHSIWVVRPAES